MFSSEEIFISLADEGISDIIIQKRIRMEERNIKNRLIRWAREPYPSLISPWKSVVSSLFAWVLPWMFPAYYDERAWTLGKEVLNTLALMLCVAVCILRPLALSFS